MSGEAWIFGLLVFNTVILWDIKRTLYYSVYEKEIGNE